VMAMVDMCRLIRGMGWEKEGESERDRDRERERERERERTKKGHENEEVLKYNEEGRKVTDITRTFNEQKHTVSILKCARGNKCVHFLLLKEDDALPSYLHPLV